MTTTTRHSFGDMLSVADELTQQVLDSFDLASVRVDNFTEPAITLHLRGSWYAPSLVNVAWDLGLVEVDHREYGRTPGNPGNVEVSGRLGDMTVVLFGGAA